MNESIKSLIQYDGENFFQHPPVQQFLQRYIISGHTMMQFILLQRHLLSTFLTPDNNNNNNVLHDQHNIDDHLIQNIIDAENAGQQADNDDNAGGDFNLGRYCQISQNIRQKINSNDAQIKYDSLKAILLYYKHINVAAPSPLHKPKPLFVSFTRSSYEDIRSVFLNVFQGADRVNNEELEWLEQADIHEIFRPPKQERADKIFGDTVMTNNVQVNFTSRRIKTEAEVQDMQRRRDINNQYVTFNHEENNTQQQQNRCSYHKRFQPTNHFTPDQLQKRLYYLPHTFAFSPQGFRTDHHVLNQHHYNSLGHKLDQAGNNLNVNQPTTLCHQCNAERNNPNTQPTPYISNNHTPQNPNDVTHVFANDPGINYPFCITRDRYVAQEREDALGNCHVDSKNYRRLNNKFNYYQQKNISCYKLSKEEYYHRLNLKQYNHAVKLETAKLGDEYVNMYRLCQGTTKKTWNVNDFMQYTSPILSDFNKCFDYAFQKFHRKFRFKRYQKKQKMIHNITREVLAGVDPEKAIIVWGNGNFRHNLRGSPPISNKGLRKRISKQVPVVISSENNTSKTSCCCHANVRNPTRLGLDNREIPIRGLLKCGACNRHPLSRDDSASLNIMWNFLALVNGQHTGPFTYHRRQPQIAG